MDADELEARLQRMREDIRDALTQLERHLAGFRTTGHGVEIYAEKARNVANEALSEIRHIKHELTTATSTKPSPETRRATAPSRSRGRRGGS